MPHLLGPLQALAWLGDTLLLHLWNIPHSQGHGPASQSVPTYLPMICRTLSL